MSSMRANLHCLKCGAASGDDWTQCHGVCPMSMSPHYDDLAARAFERLPLEPQDDLAARAFEQLPLAKQDEYGRTETRFNQR